MGCLLDITTGKDAILENARFGLTIQANSPKIVKKLSNLSLFFQVI